ncbi:Protein ccc1 [Clarireedia jacksonii]
MVAEDPPNNLAKHERLQNRDPTIKPSTRSVLKPSSPSPTDASLRDLPSSASTSASTSRPFKNTSRPNLRRNRSSVKHLPPTMSFVKVLSLVGLKNIFFQQSTISKRKSNRESKSSQYNSPVDWSTVSRQPLLGHENGRSSQLPSSDPEESYSDDSTLDLEEQDGRLEKGAQKRAFRIDARIISDATIGLSDGLTVPFALTAGLSALGSTHVVIYGGLAELIAGAISMGLGGYLGAKSELASYRATKEETERLIETDIQGVLADVAEVFAPYNLPKHTLEDLTNHLSGSPRLVDFVMQFQHCEEEPAASRALVSATTIAMGYFLGGLLPLLPYFCVDQVYTGLYISIGIMVFTLFVFGYVKTAVVMGWQGSKNIKEACFGGIQMVIVGSAAAAAAMGLVRLFNEGGSVPAV